MCYLRRHNKMPAALNPLFFFLLKKKNVFRGRVKKVGVVVLVVVVVGEFRA